MLAADDADLPETTAQWMNLTYLMRVMAADDAIHNRDSFTIFFCGDWGCMNHNFYIYQEETADRLWLIPWDPGGAFDLENWLGARPWDDLSQNCDEWYETENATTSLRPACGDPFVKSLALYKAESDAYWDALQDVLENVFVIDRIKDDIDIIVEVLEPAVAADPDREVTEWLNGMRRFKDAMAGAHFEASEKLYSESGGHR